MDEKNFKSCFEKIETASKDIEKIYRKSLEELQRYDLEVNDIYHYIELGKYDAVQGWKILKQLKNILQKRRETKDRLDVISSINQSLQANIKKYQESIEKKEKKIENNSRSYKYRTDVLDKTLSVKEKIIVKK